MSTESNSELDNKGTEMHNSVPDHLYHYTTLEGALGVMESKSIWATHALYSNDSFEILHTFEIAKKAAEDADAQRQNELTVAIEGIQSIAEHTTYVTCFCTEGDRLSQWRGYGGNAGVCLGFDFTEFRGNAVSPVLKKCIYDDSKLAAKLEELLEKTRQEISKRNGKFFPGKEPLTQSDLILLDLMELCVFHKNEAFVEEREWRLCLRPLQEYEHRLRVGKSRLIPYLTFPLGEKTGVSITKIIVGPSPNMRLTANALRLCKSKYGLKNADVMVSRIPFRPE